MNRKIAEVRDFTARQRRVLVVLECKHTVSFPSESALIGASIVDKHRVGNELNCPECLEEAPRAAMHPDHLLFWREVYVAVIRSDRGTINDGEWPASVADQAVAHLRKREGR